MLTVAGTWNLRLNVFELVTNSFHLNHNHMFLSESLATVPVTQEIIMWMVSNNMHLLRCLTLSYIRCHTRCPLLSAVNQTNK